MKANWFSQLSTLLNALPKKWKLALGLETSKLTKVQVDTHVHVDINGKLVYIDTVNTNIFYKLFVQYKFIKPYVENMWNRKFEVDNIIWKYIWIFIHTGIKENKIKQFRYKITSFILSCGDLLCKW